MAEQTYSVWRGGQEGDYQSLPASELTAAEREHFKVVEDAINKKRWYLEYYYPFPNVRFSVEVDAATQDEARAKGDEIIRGLRTVACCDVRYK
jgi:hypothetical protein